MFNFIKNISPTELAVVILVLIALFGRKAVANLGKVSGETYKEIKNIKKTFNDAITEDSKPTKGKKGVSN
jgi:Sec-independent protein translocase protein TatA